MSNFLIDEDTGLLAAEFVLGTLDSEERANARSLLRTDHGFIAMVRIWERRFGELHLMVEPVEPDAKILLRIKTKIAELPPREAAPEGKPAGSPAPLAAGLASAETPEPTDGANTGEATNTEEATKSDAEAAGETPKPPDAAADGTASKPAEIAASGEAAMPARLRRTRASRLSQKPRPARKPSRLRAWWGRKATRARKTQFQSRPRRRRPHPSNRPTRLRPHAGTSCRRTQ